MGLPYDITFGSSHVELDNVASDGTIAVPANNSPVLVATVPLTTGLVPLDVATLLCEIYISYDGVTNDGTLVSQRRNDPIAAYKGDPTPANISSANGLGTSAELSRDTTNGMRGDYYDIIQALNGSGDLEISLKGITAGAKALTFRNLSVSYRIVGSK